jgi:hypothetical protein
MKENTDIKKRASHPPNNESKRNIINEQTNPAEYQSRKLP